MDEKPIQKELLTKLFQHEHYCYSYVKKRLDKIEMAMKQKEIHREENQLSIKRIFERLHQALTQLEYSLIEEYDIAMENHEMRLIAEKERISKNGNKLLEVNFTAKRSMLGTDSTHEEDKPDYYLKKLLPIIKECIKDPYDICTPEFVPDYSMLNNLSVGYIQQFGVNPNLFHISVENAIEEHKTATISVKPPIGVTIDSAIPYFSWNIQCDGIIISANGYSENNTFQLSFHSSNIVMKDVREYEHDIDTAVLMLLSPKPQQKMTNWIINHMFNNTAEGIQFMVTRCAMHKVNFKVFDREIPGCPFYFWPSGSQQGSFSVNGNVYEDHKNEGAEDFSAMDLCSKSTPPSLRKPLAHFLHCAPKQIASGKQLCTDVVTPRLTNQPVEVKPLRWPKFAKRPEEQIPEVPSIKEDSGDSKMCEQLEDLEKEASVDKDSSSGFGSGGNELSEISSPDSMKLEHELSGEYQSVVKEETTSGDFEEATIKKYSNSVEHLWTKHLFAETQCVVENVEPFGFKNPIGVAELPNSNIVIADTFNDRMVMLDNSGNFINVLNTNDFTMKRPSAICMLKSAFAVRDDTSIWLFKMNGKFIKKFGDDYLRRPYGLTVNSDGMLLTAEVHNGCLIIVVVDPCNGELVNQLNIYYKCGKKRLFVKKPRFICFRPNNVILVVDLGANAVYIVDLTTCCVVTQFGVTGSGRGQFQDPSGIVCDRDGYILVGDSRNHRLQIFSPSGKFIMVLPVDRPLKRPSGLWLSSDGYLYVLNYWESSLVKYKLTTKY